MCGVIFLFIFEISTIEAHYTPVAPVIDGRIDSIWNIADSVTQFTQSSPHPGKPASEPTTVWILYDDANLYVAYRCETSGRKPVACLSGSEDGIWLDIDTFNDKTTAYGFYVGASGSESDDIVLDDGRNTDCSWNGVWFSKVKVYPESYIVEIKIPFRSIRYKNGLKKWGINFNRWIYKTKESVWWTPVKQEEGLRVSRFGELTGINPGVKGHGVEIYPVGFVKQEKYEETSTYPSAGLNLSFRITPDVKLLGTINPDFGQIEADPYTLNLSKYETYLAERRPFFVEGSEHFKPSSFESGSGFYSPIDVFYSRRMGKRLTTGEEVPISIATKVIGKSKSWDIGGLFARTEKLKDEPQAYWTITRYKHQLFKNSSIGVLYAGKETGKGYARALDLDGALRTRKSQFLYQIIGSNANNKHGFGINAGLKLMGKGYLLMGSGCWLSDSLDINEIGYMPNMIAGERKILLFAGPMKFYKKGVLQSLCYGIGGAVSKEPQEENLSNQFTLFLNPCFRNKWGFSFNTTFGKTYEADTSYSSKSLNLCVWSGGGRRWNTNFGFWYGYTWNYPREWLAWQGSNWLWTSYSITSKLSISASANSWIEFNPEGKFESMSSSIAPGIGYSFTKDISLSLYSEFVPLTDRNSTELFSARISFLWSWKVAPKSYVYIAFNDYRERTSQTFQEKECIGMIKLKYLFYF